MAGTNHFDILLQFHQTAIQDLQHHLLNNSPLTTLWLKSPLSRRVEQSIPPFEIKACWNSPEVNIGERGIELSVDLNGGARQALSGRILTLEGKVSVQQMTIPVGDFGGRPYVCVRTPDPTQIDLDQLKVSYEGSHWPERIARLNPEKEATSLRPVLASQLFGQLALIPLSYMPSSLPVSLADHTGNARPGTLPIKYLMPGIFASSSVVSLGLVLDDTSAPANIKGALPLRSGQNAAIAFSERGLNMLLAHLCDQNKAIGQIQHTRLGQVEWRWEKLSVTLQANALTVNGVLLQQGVRSWAVASVKSQLENNGCLQTTILASNLDAIQTETFLATWHGVLKLLLRSNSANRPLRDARDEERLFQCFDLPTSRQAVEAVAQELVITDEQLIVSYTIPESEKEVSKEVPPARPAVTIVQSQIPQQSAPGTPVTIELDTRIMKDSTPPYDYAWSNGLAPNADPHFGPKLTLSSTPLTPPVGNRPQTLTIVHLKLIDMFGQVTETQAQAQYVPANQQHAHKGGSLGYLPNTANPPSTPGSFSAPNSPVSPEPKPRLSRGCGYALLVASAIPLLLLVSIIGAGFTVLAPTLSWSGDLVPGGTFQLQGNNFLPGNNVIFTLDGSTPLYISSRTPSPQLAHGLSAAGLALSAIHMPQRSAQTNVAMADGSGKFKVTIAIGQNWQVGQHIIKAAEDSSPRSATLTITLTAPPALSCLRPPALTLGPVSEGYSEVVSNTITLCSTGSSHLDWTANWNHNQAPWLQVSPATGQMNAPGEENIQVGATAASLKAGTYMTTVTFTSQRKDVSETLNVTFTVTAACVRPRPATLSFNSFVGVSDPQPQKVTLINCGSVASWTSTITTSDNGNWLSISPTSGTMDANGSQVVTVSASTLNPQLAAGTYTGQITFSIGSQQVIVKVTLTVQYKLI